MSPRSGYAPSSWERPAEPGSHDPYTSLGLLSNHVDTMKRHSNRSSRSSSASYARGSVVFTAAASTEGQYSTATPATYLPTPAHYIGHGASSYGSNGYDSRENRSSSSRVSAIPSSSRASVNPWNMVSASPSDSSRASFPMTPPDRLMDYSGPNRTPPENTYSPEDDDALPWTHGEPNGDGHPARPRASSKAHPQRRPANRDEFDGPHQFLDRPTLDAAEARERDLPHLSTNLFVNEQDDILNQVNDCLSRCAFDFVAKYQFPIPLEADKRPVRVPADREWTEWVYLLKRLATKRRIPARVLYNGQIKQLVTVLENSLEMRHAAKHQSRPLKDDRNVLQLISAGLQVAKILKDAAAMEFLDQLYVRTEYLIGHRRTTPTYP